MTVFSRATRVAEGIQPRFSLHRFHLDLNHSASLVRLDASTATPSHVTPPCHHPRRPPTPLLLPLPLLAPINPMPPALFRPCIDLHDGKVKQIVGGSLDTATLQTNFVSESVLLPFLSLVFLAEFVLTRQTRRRLLRQLVPGTRTLGRARHQTRTGQRGGRKGGLEGVAQYVLSFLPPAMQSLTHASRSQMDSK